MFSAKSSAEMSSTDWTSPVPQIFVRIAGTGGSPQKIADRRSPRAEARIAASGSVGSPSVTRRASQEPVRRSVSSARQYCVFPRGSRVMAALSGTTMASLEKATTVSGRRSSRARRNRSMRRDPELVGQFMLDETSASTGVCRRRIASDKVFGTFGCHFSMRMYP